MSVFLISVELAMVTAVAVPDAWSTLTSTNPAYTATRHAQTYSLNAKTTLVQTGIPKLSYPGLGILPSGNSYAATTTYPGETRTIEAATITYSVGVLTIPLAPEVLRTQLVPDLLYEIDYVAPQISELPESLASRLNVGWLSLHSSYQIVAPTPTIRQKLFDDLRINDRRSNAEVDPELVLSNLDILADPSSVSAQLSTLTSLLAPYPTLVADVKEYFSVMPAWVAEKALIENNFVLSEVSITTVPASQSEDLSMINSVLATATNDYVSGVTLTNPSGTGSVTSSGSSGAAIATGDASLLMNDGLAAAGIAVVGLL